MTHIVEPAPRPGDPRYEIDRKIFRATRKLIDTDRWKLANADAGTSGFVGSWNGGFFGPKATEAGGTFPVSRGTEQATASSSRASKIGKSSV